MAAPGITVLKHNVPWGPFTRAQIEDALARGDFTVKYLAHAPGLNEWLPLGEVLDYVARHESAGAPTLPPVPVSRIFPTPPEASVPPPAIPTTPVARPPILPAPVQKKSEPPATRPIAPPVLEPQKAPVEPSPDLEPGSFFLRGIAFLIDCGILFIPVGVLFILGALAIQIPAWWQHSNHQTVVEQWALLWLNMRRMAWLLAIGCGWLYAAGLESSRSQATVGKRWMGLKVTDTNGERMTFLRATGRYAAKYLSALPCFLGFIMALFSSRGLSLHDRLAGSRVVRS